MKINQKNIFLNLLVINFLNLLSCDYKAEKNHLEPEMQWVYVEIVTESRKDTTEYFYYAQMKKSIIDEIELNEDKKGLFSLYNIRYMNNDGLLELYEDEILKGTLIFKIQDIEEVTLYKDDPVNLFALEELHESTKKFKRKSKNHNKRKDN